MSFYRANPELSWVGVADASTTEEALEVMEGHIRTIDQRIKSLGTQLEQRFAILNENLFGLGGKYEGRCCAACMCKKLPGAHSIALWCRAVGIRPGRKA